MLRTLSLFLAFKAINTNVFAAEAGMPQLDPTYWASQVFWLILIFFSIFTFQFQNFTYLRLKIILIIEKINQRRFRKCK